MSRDSARILALVSDAFGGYGGVSVFNRAFLQAIAMMDEVETVAVLPRVIDHEESVPLSINQNNDATQGARKYINALVKQLQHGSQYDLIICGHINLLPLAWLAKLKLRCPMVLVVHGIDVDAAMTRPGYRFFARRIDHLVSVSSITLKKFQQWVSIKEENSTVLPNSIRVEDFSAGPKPEYLLDRYQLHGRRILMTLGRLAGKDRQKGFDEVIEALPGLIEDYPDIVYLIAGDGKDKHRLQAKAERLGVAEQVYFCGRVNEEDKVSHYQLADIYVMPSQGEGFGIVILEALACGIPVIGSTRDGTREALKGGELGRLVDPQDPSQLLSAVKEELNSPSPAGVQPGLRYFSRQNFNHQTASLVRGVMNV